MVTFGGYDTKAYAKPGKIFWAQIKNDERYWTVPMTGAGLKDMKGRIDLAGVKA